MGFDGFDNVELVMELEDRLHISIPDKDAERLFNPGDLVKYLVGRLGSSNPSIDYKCRSASAFRQGRNILKDAGLLPIENIRPSTPVKSLFSDQPSVGERRAAWSRIGETCGLRVPNLRHPRRYRILAMLLVCAASGIFFSISWTYSDHTRWNPLAAGAVVLSFTFGIFYAFLFATRNKWADAAPEGFDTMGDLTSCLTLNSIPDNPLSLAGWTAPELWELVRDLTAKSADCPPSKIKRNTSFVGLHGSSPN